MLSIVLSWKPINYLINNKKNKDGNISNTVVHIATF